MRDIGDRFDPSRSIDFGVRGEALIDCYGRVVGDFEEGDDALALAVGPFDRGAGGADVGPVVADAAGPFGELGVVGDDFEDVVRGRP